MYFQAKQVHAIVCVQILRIHAEEFYYLLEASLFGSFLQTLDGINLEGYTWLEIAQFRNLSSC